MRQTDGNMVKEIREALEFAKFTEIRNDICKFAEYCLRDEKGKPWKLGKHHREWYKLLWDQVKDIVEPGKHTRPASSKDNLLLMAPREHGKTSTMVCFLLFCFGKNPNLRIKYVSGSDDLAMDVVGQVKKNIERNKELHEVFPYLKKDNSGSWSGSALDMLKVDFDGTWQEADLGIKDANLEAYGITAPATGGRADIIVFDDIIRSREAIQEPKRLETITKLFYTDWLNIGGYRHIVIGTPWTPDDVHAQLSQNDEWDKWKKSAIIDGKPLWPERWPIEKLLSRRKQIGEVAFDLQFMLTGIKEKMSWWTQDIIDRCKDRTFQYGQLPLDFELDGVVVGFDPAASMKQTGSWSCIFAIAYDKYKRRVPLRIIRKRGRDGQPRMLAETLVDMLLEIEEFLTERSGNSTVLRDCRANMVTVENNATQQAFVDLINLVCENRNINIRVPIQGVFTGTQKWNPELGLPRMVGDFENLKWVIPWGGEKHKEPIDPLHECPICFWIQELLGYPHDTETTDMIMSSWLASASIDRAVIKDLPVTIRKRVGSIHNVNWG